MERIPPIAPEPTALRPVRVLHVIKTYVPETQGGMEEAVRQLCAVTAGLGVTSTVLTLTRGRTPQDEQRSEARVVAVPRTAEAASCPVALGGPGAFRRLVRQTDVVQYHFPWPFGDLLDRWRPARVPSIVTYQSDIVRQRRLLQLYRPLMHSFLHRAARIVVASPGYARGSPHLGRYTDKLEVIPLGLDEATYGAPDPARVAAWRERLGEGFFLFMGVLRYYKGLHVLVEAVRGAPYRVALLGGGPMEGNLRAQAQASGTDNVVFLGRLPDEDKLALLALCRAVVLPSHLRSEAFGIALLEGAMLGKPLVSCEIGTGTTFINLDGETGYAVPPEDPAALRRALDALAADPAVAEALGRGARQRFEALFTAEAMGARYRELYDRVLAEASAH